MKDLKLSCGGDVYLLHEAGKGEGLGGFGDCIIVVVLSMDHSPRLCTTD